MGIHDLLQQIPTGNEYFHSFYDAGNKLQLVGKVVPIDAASALWQFAARHGYDFLHGNFIPALSEWAHWIHHLRSICGWKLKVIMDGRENVDKAPEAGRRAARAKAAKEANNITGKIKNTPEYIIYALKVCKLMQIDVIVSAYEADPQAAYEAIKKELIPVTGDSDFLGYGVKKLILVKGFHYEWYRIIDMTVEVNQGEYPLYDLYNVHGTIVFQLYAGCRGCDFTEVQSGISGIGFNTFIELAEKAGEEGELNAETLAATIWEDKNVIATNNDFKSAAEVQQYLQHVVDVYCNGLVYDERGTLGGFL